MKFSSKNSGQGGRTAIMWAIGAVAFSIAFYFFFLRSSDIETDIFLISESTDIPEIDTSFLEQDILDDFRSWGVLPIKIGPAGKTNLFSQ